MKAKSKSYITSAKTMFAALTILSKNGGDNAYTHTDARDRKDS